MRCLNLGTYMALKWRWHLLEPLGLSRNGAHTALAYLYPVLEFIDSSTHFHRPGFRAARQL